MNVLNVIPSPNDPKVLSFCESICPGQKPFLVPIVPRYGCAKRGCFGNVEETVRLSGGGLVYGWEVSQVPKVYLEAVFHAVWQKPQGGLECCTPREVPQPKLLFLRDVHRTHTDQEIPPYRISLSVKLHLVEQLWVLIDQKVEILNSLQLGGFPPDHSASIYRLRDLTSEIVRLRERIESGRGTDK